MDASLFVDIRKRLGQELIAEMNERIHGFSMERASKKSDKRKKGKDDPPEGESKNKGEVIYDATVCPQVDSSKSAYALFLENWDLSLIDFVEQFKVMLLNRNNRVLGTLLLSTGGTSGTVVDAKLVFATALKANASAIILSHNHPSGTKRPSDMDCRLTKKLVEAGKQLDLPILDHIIVTSEGYYSFADEGAITVNDGRFPR